MLKRNRGKHAGHPQDGLQVPPPPPGPRRPRRSKGELPQDRLVAVRGEARRGLIAEATVRRIITQPQMSRLLSLCREMEGGQYDSPPPPPPPAAPPSPERQAEGLGWPSRHEPGVTKEDLSFIPGFPLVIDA